MSELDLELMRLSGRILGETLRFLTEQCIYPGVSTLDISKKAEEFIRSHDRAIPAFVGYRGFPEAVCVSLNNQVVHTIPNKSTIVKEGDLVSVDCGVIVDGHFSDACRTVTVGNVLPRAKQLVKITREALYKGIERARAGNRISDISYNIQKHVERHGFEISRNYGGHGIGLVLHGPPSIPNYGPPGKGNLITVGTCLAIEPVVFDGPTDTLLLDDGWTIVSKYGNISAHFEETIIVTKEGPEIVTK